MTLGRVLKMQNIVSGFNNANNWEGLCDHVVHCCIHRPILKPKLTTSVIHECWLDEIVPDLIQQPKMYAKLEVPKLGRHTLQM